MALAGVDVAKEAVVEGVVVLGGTPVEGAYVRLLDTGGDFAAEVRTGEAGEFRFFAAPGPWTLRVLAPGRDRVDHDVEARLGEVTEIRIEL